jgi:hypothetical protein
VGQTCDSLKRNSDFLNLKVQYGGKRIENARIKYGPQNFGYEILEEVTSESEEELSNILNELEILYISKYDSFHHGYNNTIGGGGALGYRHTEEYKQWQSELSKVLNSDPEIKAKQKAGMTAYFNSPGAREKRSQELQKRYENPDEREKLSNAQKESYASNPERAKKRNANLSATCSTPEGRKRMGETSRNAWIDDDYRAKQSARIKAQWADPEYKAAYKERNRGMNGKHVLQLTLSGEVIHEYISACEAARVLGYAFSSICRVCRGERNQYKGFLWKYVD